MKEIYELLKRLCELEPERFYIDKFSPKSIKVRLGTQWYRLGCWSDFSKSLIWREYWAKSIICDAIREAIEERGWKWHIGNDHGIENRPDYVAVITINDDGLYATEFGEVAIIALLRAYVTALRSALIRTMRDEDRDNEELVSKLLKITFPR